MINAKQYQEVRLWSGITLITWNLILVWLAWLACDAVHYWNLPFVLLAAGAAVGIILAALPFEILSGWASESLAGQSQQRLKEWLRDWARAAAVHALGLTLAITAFGYASLLPWPFKCAIVVALAVIAISFLAISQHLLWRVQPPDQTDEIERELASLGIACPEICWVDDAESHAVNGTWVGFGPGRRLAISQTVASGLSSREAALIIAREVEGGRRGIPGKSFAIAVTWLIAGAAIAVSLPSGSKLQAGLIGIAAMTTWCLVALFVLPATSRRWNNELDRWMVDLATPGEGASLLTKLQQLNATDTELPPGKTAVFHPISPMSDRIAAVSTSTSARE